MSSASPNPRAATPASLDGAVLADGGASPVVADGGDGPNVAVAHPMPSSGIVDGVEPGLGVAGDGGLGGDDGVAGLNVDGAVPA